MDYFAGLDVSVKETSVCIVDDAGKIMREARVAREPEALLQVLTNTIYRFKRVARIGISFSYTSMPTPDASAISLRTLAIPPRVASRMKRMEGTAAISTSINPLSAAQSLVIGVESDRSPRAST